MHEPARKVCHARVHAWRRGLSAPVAAKGNDANLHQRLIWPLYPQWPTAVSAAGVSASLACAHHATCDIFPFPIIVVLPALRVRDDSLVHLPHRCGIGRAAFICCAPAGYPCHVPAPFIARPTQEIESNYRRLTASAWCLLRHEDQSDVVVIGYRIVRGVHENSLDGDDR